MNFRIARKAGQDRNSVKLPDLSSTEFAISLGDLLQLEKLWFIFGGIVTFFVVLATGFQQMIIRILRNLNLTFTFKSK